MTISAAQSAAQPSKPSPAKVAIARIRKLETVRIARLKRIGRSVIDAAKRADVAAKTLLLEDLKDVQSLCEDIIKTPESAAETTVDLD